MTKTVLIIIFLSVSSMFCRISPSAGSDSPFPHLQSRPLQEQNCFCVLSLEGFHAFASGDNLQWAMPEYPASETFQTKIAVPGSWQSQAVKSVTGTGWYRISFSYSPALGKIYPAVLLGRIGNADEVFLNGIRIGGEGRISPKPVEASWVQRLYRLPESLLRSDRPNVLAVRVLNTWGQSGILENPVCIGDYSLLSEIRNRRESVRMVTETAISVSVFLCFTVFLYLYAALRRREYLGFGMFLFVYGLISVLESLFVYENGLKTPFVQQIINALAGILPAAGLFTLVHISRKNTGLMTKILMSLFVLTAAGLFFSSDAASSGRWIVLWTILLAVTSFVYIWLAAQAFFRKYSESGPVLTAVICLLIGTLAESAGIGLNLPLCLSLHEYGILAFLFFLFCALMARHSRIQKHVHVLSQKILDAHEEERKRLSRELHDGIGQSLVAIRLYLQMVHAKMPSPGQEKEMLLSSISELSALVEELRSISMNLRPVTIEHFRVTELLRWHGRKFSEKTGIAVTVSGDEVIDVPMNVRDHLYRICQEAFANISKHAKAGQVHVSVENRGKMLCIEIADNGTGFDLIGIRGKNQGMGLCTMKERTELLSGIFRIQSRPGKGTKIQIAVPLG